MVIDDVACEKSKSATKIEAAKLQYTGSEKDLVNCNVVVTSYYVDEVMDFPVNLSPYVPADEFEEGENSPDFFTKIQLGKKLALDAIEKGIQFKEALFDNWYLCYDFVSFLRAQGKDWISTLKSNDIIYRLSKRRPIRKKKKRRRKMRKGIYCREVSQFPSTKLFSGNNKGLQGWQRGKKIHLGSEF